MRNEPDVIHLKDVRPAMVNLTARPTPVQREYLSRGLTQPGGKLPLFDSQGQRYSDRTIRSCIEHGWAEPWFNNPLKPNWLVCKITSAGRQVIAQKTE